MPTDQTHNPNLQSWVADANGHPDFPIQNLPFAIFTPPGEHPRGGVAIGDHILDLSHLHQSCLLSPVAHKVCASAAGIVLDHFLTLGTELRTLLRHELSALLAERASPRPELLHRATDCTLHLPTSLRNYTDFYAGIHHARNAGSLFRPENPLLPNYKWVPIGYHGRASSVRPSGVPVVRPQGQRKLPHQSQPTFGPSRSLDFELELGLWIGPGNALDEPIPIERAQDHIAGFCLLNDWSARDLQSWESQPLGPFLAKSFATTISPWIVTPEALAPFRIPQQPRPQGDPEPLPYLHSPGDQQAGALALDLEILILTPGMRTLNLAPERLTRTNAEHLYWTPAQLVAHHASNGCNLQPGDLLGTGTISSPPPGNAGSLLELTRAGAEPLQLASGEQRRYLEDGDEILLRAFARRDGFVSIGFGECRATIKPCC